MMRFNKSIANIAITLTEIKLAHLTSRAVKFLSIFSGGSIAFNLPVISIFSRFYYCCLLRDIEFVGNVRLCFYISFYAPTEI